MKYYVVADVHGFYSEMIKALTEAGFFNETEPCKVIVCGDLLDRGKEANKMIEFMLQLLREDKLIYILGNHENLMDYCLMEMARSRTVDMRHHINGTWDTLLQISGMSNAEGDANMYEMVQRVRESEYYNELLPAAVDYFETENYIFVHGWIPCRNIEGGGGTETGEYDPDWREADYSSWKTARNLNGMRLACYCKVTEPGKTVVCGHWHASYGHTYFGGVGSERGEKAVFTPFYADGIIAIDGCTAVSGMVNCIVIEDNELEA